MLRGRIPGPLVSAAVVAISVALFVAAPAMAAPSDIPAPTVSGPIPTTADSTPWSATDKPLDSYGYVEEEFTYEGDAFRYDPAVDPFATATRLTTGGPADDGKYPYRTRMIVRRPADPDDFNGTVVVEWQNVTAQFDLEANWFGDPEYLLENGYAYVAISAQRVGVNFLRGWDADRYGELDVSARDAGGVETITTDGLSYDIYAAGIKALLDGGDGADPLGPLALPETVIATGESQSGGRLNTYYNNVAPLHEVIDAYLLTVASGTIRDDRPEPMIRILSETENRIPRPAPDAANYRQWEVAGGSHFPRMAFENLQAPIERDLNTTLSATCVDYPLSRVQWPFVVNSAYEHLVDWANGGPPAPIAPRGEYQDTPADPNNQLVRDELGIAQGGIRLPEVSVPARLNNGLNQTAGPELFSLLCFLYGSTQDLTEATLLGLYDDFADYIAQVTTKAEEVADQGFILDQDVPRLIAMHEQVPNLRPTSPERTSGEAKNKGAFTLSWLGTKAPQTTFDLQRAKVGTDAFTDVGSTDEPEFDFTGKGEQDGDWVYRVRSSTVIPADAVRDEFTITTPFSELSDPVTVDKTKPKLSISCPRKVKRGDEAFARFKASDAGVGLRKDPTGKRRIRTGRKGTVKVEVKAVDRLKNTTKKSCKVEVVR